MGYTEKQLYAFVWRADTREKIALAERWLRAHFSDMGADLFDDLMVTLSQQNRQICAAEQGRKDWF